MGLRHANGKTAESHVFKSLKRLRGGRLVIDAGSAKVATGDIGAVANTILVMGSERVGSRIGRFMCVVKHRGSAMSDEIAEYRVGEQGLTL